MNIVSESAYQRNEEMRRNLCVEGEEEETGRNEEGERDVDGARDGEETGRK